MGKMEFVGLPVNEAILVATSALRHDGVVLNSPGSFMFPTQVILSEHDNEMSRRLMRILKKLRESDPSYYQLPYLVRQGEQPKEGLLLLVNLEDQMGGTSGYVDWIILQIHRQVQQNT
ncbi:protein transport protein Sec24-like [Gossypium australe]|uniref:Protein transport protein Sec24-like n=1 Tax=Gossypium australe TaxID=47621 RepID=A0A5B6VTY7_9ROSI|nr:protein transport protein Sec24-like [Gossypium australe]